MKTEVSKYLAKIAKKGGSSGRGAAKRRTREQCQAAAQAMHAKRRAKSAANVKGEPTAPGSSPKEDAS